MPENVLCCNLQFYHGLFFKGNAGRLNYGVSYIRCSTLLGFCLALSSVKNFQRKSFIKWVLDFNIVNVGGKTALMFSVNESPLPRPDIIKKIYERNLRMFVISRSVCPWEAFPG